MSAAAARVLALLRGSAGAACSGQSLSDELGVSRAQVWKHVETLRRRGYEIEGEPGGGYRLQRVPDRLYPEEVQEGLETRWLARRLEHLDDTDSTNRVAMELGRAGAEAGTTVVAEGQRAGRGRLGRSFFSPAYLNLYTSILLRPELSLGEAPGLILASAVAVAESVAAALPDPVAEQVEIKWPNDVLVGGLKTSGILMELHAEGSRVDFAVLGIGVNLNVAREDFPPEFRDLATSLRSAGGRPVDRIAFARSLYGMLEPLLELQEKGGLAAIRPRFDARFRMVGRRVRVLDAARATPSPGESEPGSEPADAPGLEGVVAGIDGAGSLLVEDDAGRRHTVVAGDVTLAKVGASGKLPERRSAEEAR